MQTCKLLFSAAALIISCSIAMGQALSLPPSGGNQPAQVVQHMGMVEVSIAYSSPDVADREGKIWGQLVPYGLNNLGFGTATAAPWRAGANENTVFQTSHDIMVEGEKLPAGRYGLHMIVRENEPWTVIFSKNHTAWGSFFYDEAQDQLRVDVTPESHAFTEWLTFDFTDRKLDSCTLTMKWEHMALPVRLSVPDINALYLTRIRDELSGPPGFYYQNYQSAATFCVQQNMNLEEALVWADAAISMPFIGQKNFSTMQTKATVLAALGREDESDQIMQEAINLPGADMRAIHQYGRQLISQGKPEKALEVFEKNRKMHPDDNFTTLVGLARGHTAMGNKKKAIQYWEEALENLPENQRPYRSIYEQELQKVKEM